MAKKVSQKQRDAYRFALEDKGVPDVIAFMASRNIDRADIKKRMPADLLIGGFFWWSLTPEGEDFWNAAHKDANHLEASK